jgi:hypothetical protein
MIKDMKAASSRGLDNIHNWISEQGFASAKMKQFEAAAVTTGPGVSKSVDGDPVPLTVTTLATTP